MRAIILAAGRGSRLRDLTRDMPKPLVPYRGKRLIDWQLDAITKNGIRNIAVVCGYKKECFDLDVKYFENPRWAQTNMVASLACARPWLEKSSTVISYGDIVYGKNTLSKLMSAPGEIVISYDPNWLELWQSRFEDPLEDAESFLLNDDQTLRDIGEKPTNLEQIEGQYMGLIKLTVGGWSVIQSYLKSISPELIDKLDMTSLLQRLIKNGVKINAVAIDEPWFEFDSPSDILEAEKN